MIIHLNGSEKVNIKDKDNGFYEITIDGIDFRLPDGTIQKGRMIIPNSKIESEMFVDVCADNVNKSLFTIELGGET